jgi:hypothetical protein
MLRILAALVAAAGLLFAGCAGTQPIQNVEKAPVILPPGKSATLNQVTTAIMRAGTRLGWEMKPAGRGRISGRLVLREHIANVNIEHDAKSYSIKYRDSTNLDAKDGKIHRNYNGWIQNLDKAIRAELTAL